ncbi:MAG: hypothetical protein JO209_01425 [Acidisphaera sp.]|nr:hypothetical protein [Acidisphaera sp.]
MVVGALIVAAALITSRLGFAGLFLLGGLTWLDCTLASLDQKVPTWGVDVFRAAAERPRSAEARVAADADHQAMMSPLRFYGWCGAFLAAVGAAGFAWQLWM